MISAADVTELMGRWWFDYDRGSLNALPGLLTEDMHFVSRTDTGASMFEDFVRADITGRDQVIAWQTQHRLGSPYPLRHTSANVHLVDADDGRAKFASYMYVTHIVDGKVTVASGTVMGEVRQDEGVLRLADLEVVVDTVNGETYRDRSD